MARVYSSRRAVLAVAVVVALLFNPLLAAATDLGGTDSGPQTVATSTNSLGLTEEINLTSALEDDTETATATSTTTQTATSTPISTSTSTTTESDDLVDDLEGTVEDAEDTLDDTVENTSDDLEDAVDETNETLEDGSDDIENTLDDFEDETTNVTVEDALAGETVAVDVPRAQTPVAFDELAIEVQRDGGFELGLTSSADTFDAPPLAAQPGTVPLGYVRLDHTIANENVGNVTVTFGVDAERIDDASLDPEAVALYRYSNGEWTELPTELVDQEDGRYVYRAESPGLSEFSAGAKRPSFEVPAATVETDSVAVGDDVAVRVRIENHGGADGVFTAALSFDGQVVEERDVSVAAEGNRVVTFREAVETPGSYVVSINDVRAGDVTVQPAGTTAAPTASGPDEAGVAPASGQPGFGPLVAVVALFLWMAIIRRR